MGGFSIDGRGAPSPVLSVLEAMAMSKSLPAGMFVVAACADAKLERRGAGEAGHDEIRLEWVWAVDGTKGSRLQDSGKAAVERQRGRGRGGV